jgi:S-adenosylmethionine hydrolase
MAPPSGLITLLTDFGLADTYVGVMKGVILGLCPSARLVDLTHAVPPQDVRAGAYHLVRACPYFPPGTVHLAVVDPGVGGGRRPLAVAGARAFYVGPDNGLLAAAVRAELPGAPVAGGRLALRPPVRAVTLTSAAYRLPEVSDTFHGRDIFAPAAAHLAAGVPLAELGPAVADLVAFDDPPPQREAAGLSGRVVHVDRFGNLITDLPAADLPRHPRIEIAGATIMGLSRSYEEGDDLLAIVSSGGTLEIAAHNASAAERLGVATGAEVRVTDA